MKTNKENVKAFGSWARELESKSQPGEPDSRETIAPGGKEAGKGGAGAVFPCCQAAEERPRSLAGLGEASRENSLSPLPRHGRVGVHR